MVKESLKLSLAMDTMFVNDIDVKIKIKHEVITYTLESKSAQIINYYIGTPIIIYRHFHGFLEFKVFQILLKEIKLSKKNKN